MNTVKLNSKQLGEGFPVLILHGLFGMLDNWMRVANVLAEQYQIFLVDLRNHGRSPHSKEMSFELMAADVLKFMEDHWIFEAYLVGHSLGGKVAMQLALSHPDIVKKMVVVDIAPKEYAPGHDHIIEALERLDLKKAEDRGDLDILLAKDLEEKVVRQFLLKNVQRLKDGSFRWRMNFPVIVKAYPALIKAPGAEHSFPGPTLFLSGSKSHYMQEDDKEPTKRLFPHAEFTVIHGAGHWVHADAPEETIEAILKFFSGKS